MMKDGNNERRVSERIWRKEEREGEKEIGRGGGCLDRNVRKIKQG